MCKYTKEQSIAYFLSSDATSSESIKHGQNLANILASPQVTDEQIDKAETGPRRDVLPDWPGETVADRLDAIAGECKEGSQRQSDLYAAAIIWRKRAETRMAALEESIEAVITLFEADETPYLPDITRAIRALLSAPPAAETPKNIESLIEHIAKEWDECIYDAGSMGNLDVGSCIREAAQHYLSRNNSAASQEVKPVAADVETDINRRWESGTDHHPKSIELFKAISKIDYDHCGGYFCWKSGGDGDNGETFMYQLDIYFERLDAAPQEQAPSGSAALNVLRSIIEDGYLSETNTHRGRRILDGSQEQAPADKDALSIKRYEFLRSVMGMTPDEVVRITDAMDIFKGQKREPTPEDFDASVDAGIAALQPQPQQVADGKDK